MSEKEIRKKQRKERKILLLLCIPLKTDNTITIMDTFQAVDIDSLLLDISLRENREAFRQLFECCYAPLCLYAKRFIDDFDTREDIVQEVFRFGPQLPDYRCQEPLFEPSEAESLPNGLRTENDRADTGICQQDGRDLLIGRADSHASGSS